MRMVLLVKRASSSLCVNVPLATLVFSVKHFHYLFVVLTHISFRSMGGAGNPCVNGDTCKEGFKQFVCETGISLFLGQRSQLPPVSICFIIEKFRDCL